jgi:sulfatase modifying factor 1
MFPWGNYYLRNKKGCLLANFKPGRGNYPEDGGFYTVRADAYWPNDFGLYCMAVTLLSGLLLYYEGSYNFQHDMNPDVRWNAKDDDPPRMKRKVIRGGSWKDVGYYLQTGTVLTSTRILRNLTSVSGRSLLLIFLNSVQVSRN